VCAQPRYVAAVCKHSQMMGFPTTLLKNIQYSWNSCSEDGNVLSGYPASKHAVCLRRLQPAIL